MLADEGVYLGSESSMARVLRAHGQNTRRGRAKAPKASRPPTTHIATAPGQVWCWDMTYLPANIMGRWFHLYLILDLYSRKIVGAEVHDSDDADHAVHLVRRTALAESIATLDSKPVLHGDNGSTLKATTVLAMLQWLGIKPSYSRPRVSDDNAYAESLFRTAKYRPEFPAKGFASLDEARSWAAEFVRWYNVDHRHSGIRYVSPQQRHAAQLGWRQQHRLDQHQAAHPGRLVESSHEAGGSSERMPRKDLGATVDLLNRADDVVAIDLPRAHAARIGGKRRLAVPPQVTRIDPHEEGEFVEQGPVSQRIEAIAMREVNRRRLRSGAFPREYGYVAVPHAERLADWTVLQRKYGPCGHRFPHAPQDFSSRERRLPCQRFQKTHITISESRALLSTTRPD
jgi:transposase InsO family protein